MAAIVERDETVDVLITGFEPFGTHAINPSWEVMRLLDQTQIKGWNVRAHRLPVEYEPVQAKIPQLWEQYPSVKLVIHCGVGREGGIELEQRARNGPYVRLDNQKTFPETKCSHVDDGDCERHTTLSLPAVIARVRDAYDGNINIKHSFDAGLYLCEFSLYQSLRIGKAPAVFVHVPPFDKPYSQEDLTQRAHIVVQELVAQAQLNHAQAQPAKPKQPLPKVGLAVFVSSDAHPGCVLLGKRLTKGYGCHSYATPGGHLEMFESFEDCARRETQEECGIALSDLKYAMTLNLVQQEAQYHYLDVIMVAKTTEEPKNMEPDKCEGWGWYKWTELPQPLFASFQELFKHNFDPFAKL
eukprot:m.16781 g.16781  ORF g.16781 m.16781 type:complete len:355 (-) comp7236_c0_seq1:2678-3742(-)